MSQLFGTRTYFAATLVAIIAILFLIDGTSPQLAQQRPVPAEPDYKGSFKKYERADAVTAKIRDGRGDLVRVKFGEYSEREKAKDFGTVIQDFGSTAIIATRKTAEMKRAGLAVQKLEKTVNLPGKTFDPVIAKPSGTFNPGTESAADSDYYVVQFGAVTTDDLRKSLRDAGVEVLQYVPHQAFFVYGDGEAIAKVAGHSRVRWVGKYTSEQKSTDELAAIASDTKGGTGMFDVAVFAHEDLDGFVRRFRGSIYGRIKTANRLPTNFFNVLRVEMPVGEVSKALELPGVFRIDPYVRPVAEDERAAQIVAGNYSDSTTLIGPGYDPLTQFGVDGTGVTIGIVDNGVAIPGAGGLYITAANAVDANLRGVPPGSLGHGHSVATMAAGSTPFGVLDPLGYKYGMGVAPGAHILNIPFLRNEYLGTYSDTVGDAVTTAGPNGVRASIINNSWGSGLNGNSYDSLAAQYDGFVRDASIDPSIDPLTIVFSAGNSGTSGMTRPKVSKNTISVANSENIRTELIGTGADNIEDLRSSSSRGPAADGRIKPDITAPGTAITSGNGTSNTCGIDENNCWGSGTSFAAPQIAGVAALFTQQWRNANSGETPRPSLIKAAIINTAQEMNGNLTSDAIPNGAEGWGRVHLKAMLNTGVPTKYVNEAQDFATVAETVIYSGTVFNPTKPFRVSLVWTDPPGTGNPALVNNLDLTVTVGANTYHGNVFTGGISVTGGANSTIDNVENVFLPAGLSVGTQVSISVTATALNGDGILGNADATDQHFSLVAYNFAETIADAEAPYDFTGDGKSDLSVFRPESTWWFTSTEPGGGSGVGVFDPGPTLLPVVLVPADYTGDGKTDMAYYQRFNGNGNWVIRRSEDSQTLIVPFGLSDDIAAPGDFDGDDKADAAVFRPGTGVWYIARSTGGVDIVGFGQNGDLPAVGDYDGDGKDDIAIYRPNGATGGEWWINRSTGGFVAFQFGSATDKIVQGDYTGDGRTDAAFWRPSTGEWFVLRSEDSSYYAFPFGQTGDLPVPGDYDGDGKYDVAVFRPADALWYVSRTTAGIYIAQFGITTDTPVPSAYVR